MLKQLRTMTHRVLLTTLGLGVGVAVSAQEPLASTASVRYYSDCTNLVFNSVDSQHKTKAEELAALDDDFLMVLHQSEECMTQAAGASADRVAGAAASGQGSDGNGAAGGDGTDATSTDNSDAEAPTDQSQQPPSSRGGRGEGIQEGSTGLCDTVRQAMEAATTDAERAHFKALQEQYNCK